MNDKPIYDENTLRQLEEIKNRQNADANAKAILSLAQVVEAQSKILGFVKSDLAGFNSKLAKITDDVAKSVLDLGKQINDLKKPVEVPKKSVWDLFKKK